MGVGGVKIYAIVLQSSDFSFTYGCGRDEDICDYAAI